MSTVTTMEKNLNQHLTTPTSMQQQPLSVCVERALQNYFSQLGDNPVVDLYDMVLGEVEPALLKMVLQHTKGNQSKAAILMGISRGTLRKKLAIYDLD